MAKTRNGMPATAWKKYVNFASKNFPPSFYSGTFKYLFLIILLIRAKYAMLIATVPFSDRRSFLFFYVFAEERLSFAEESGDDGHKDDRRDDGSNDIESGSA